MLPIKKLSDVQKSGNTTVNMLIYGDSGTGKTTFASTAAELGKVLLIDAEAGSKFIKEELANNIDIIELTDVRVLDEVLKPENIVEYQTIVLDSITEILKKLVDKIKGSKERASLQDWGSIINQMETYFRRFRDTGKNVILVALTAEKEDEGVILKRPSLSGKNLPADVIGFQDICIYLENTASGRVAHTQPSQKFYAKDRTGKLPEKITQENLTVKFVVDSTTMKPQPLTEEQLTKIWEGINRLKLTEEAILKMAAYGGAPTIEELSPTGADKVIKAIDIKVSMLPKEDTQEAVQEPERDYEKELEEAGIEIKKPGRPKKTV